jgi:uncharacterized protein YegJ (DUF2314 family)
MRGSLQRLWQWLEETANWWAYAALGTGLFVLGQAAYLNRWTIGSWPRPSVVAAVVGIAFGFAIIRGLPWGRWAGVVWIALLLVVQLINGTVLGWGISQIVGLVIIPLMAVSYYFVFFREARKAEGENKVPFLSLVLLFRESRFLDATILASLASRAWNIEITASRHEDEVVEASAAETESGDEHQNGGYVVGEPPLFIVMHPSALCMVNHFDRPYMDDPEASAKQINELRIRQAILEHQAWTSVDVMQWFGQNDEKAGAYRLIARLLAELADDNVLAIVDPAASRIYCYDPETERKLRSDDPLAALREEYFSPIVSVDSDDAEMQAAVAEAHRRWPDFVAAFEARQPDDTAFAVKAPFGEKGRLEFMWLEVTGIENDVIYGTLLNEPANVSNLKMGDRVTVPLAELNDFLCKINNEAVGAFTMKVLAERAKHPPPVRKINEGDE